MQKIAIVVPLYYCNTDLYLKITSCYISIAGLEDHRLIVIDDASPLNIPSDWYITGKNRKNLGFTKTVNKGLKRAFERDTGIVIVMNDDIVITPECFERFKGLTGLQIASPRDTASSDDDRFGACWGMTREVYKLLGGLDEKYKHFYSDLDYYLRAKDAGVEIIKWDDITLPHSESSTFKHLDKNTLLNQDRERFENV